jgi:glutathione S-transferase
MAGLKLLGRTTSINVRKVTWLLGELGAPYEREDWGLPLRDPKVPEFLALNPNAQVPVLVDDGFVLWESNAIIRYLAALHEHFLPANLEGRALVDQWLAWQLGELNPQWGYAVYAYLRRNPAYTDAARIADSVARWIAKLSVLEGQLQKHRHVAGDDFTIADIAIALSTHRWLSTPMPDRKAFPAIEDHYARMKARPAGAPWLTEATP